MLWFNIATKLTPPKINIKHVLKWIFNIFYLQYDFKWIFKIIDVLFAEK